MPWLEAYHPTVWAMGTVAGLFLIQILIVDFSSIRAKHPPGTPVPVDHNNFLFRATRAHANTNESIAAFALLALAGILSTAPAAWLNGLAWTYVLGRTAHMLCYYANLGLARSSAFALALVALLGMLLVTVMSWTL